MTENEVQRELHAAIRAGDEDKFFRLLDEYHQLHAMTIFGTWLHLAASHRRLEIVRRLIAMGLSPNVRGESFDYAPINDAASEGCLEVVKYLYECGATLDVSEPTRNPLFAAIYGGHTEVARFLIDRGIDTTVKYSGNYMTNMDALAFAREWGRADIVTLLEAKQREAS